MAEEIAWVEVQNTTREPGEDATYFLPFRYPSFQPVEGMNSKWAKDLLETEKRVIYLPTSIIWKEVPNEGPLGPGQEPTFFIKVDASGNPVHSSVPNRIVWKRDNIRFGERIIWLDDEMNAIQSKIDKKVAADQRLAEENSKKIIADIKRRRIDPTKKSHFRFSDLGLPKISPSPTPAEVLATQIKPELFNRDLEFFLPHVSHKPREDFLRWGLLDSRGEYVFDPKNTLNAKVIDFVASKGLIPSLFFGINQETVNSPITNVFISKRRTQAGTPINEEYDIKPTVPRREEYIEIIANFIRRTPFFLFGYKATLPSQGDGGIGHVVFMRSNKTDEITISDPTGQAWNDPTREMTPDSRRKIDLLFGRAGIRRFVDQSCKFQVYRGSCLLWSIFFGLYADKTPEQLLKMIDNVVKFVGLPQTAESRDSVIMEIMFEFIQNPIPVTSVNREEHMSGFGKSKRKLRGKAMPEGLIPLQQMAKEAYNLVDPKKEINGWELKRWTSTLKFYVKGNEVIVAVRGTKTNAPDGSLDVTADLTIPFNGIPGTIRYKFDKAMVEKFQQEYPPSQYSYFAVGHSLGGAIIDSLIRDRLIREAVSYNPAIQFSDINRGLPNRRIYYGSDPLYRLMGWWDVKSEHREPENRTWADFLSGISLPAAAIAALPAHNLSNFEGGKRVVFT